MAGRLQVRYRQRMIALRKPAPTRVMLDEFLAWNPGDPSVRAWQLIGGEPVAMAPGTDAHGAIQSEVARLLSNYLLAQGSLYRVVTEPGIVPRVGADWNYRVPDLGVTSAPPSNELMLPEPVLLIEILSPSSEAETRANIWAYATVPTVKEILAIRSTRIEAELLIRNPDGRWPAEPAIIGPGGDVSLPSIGFAAPLAALYRTAALAPRR
jgi:Uma2 family endonuclease